MSGSEKPGIKNPVPNKASYRGGEKSNRRLGTGVTKDRDNCGFPQLSQLFLFLLSVHGFHDWLTNAFQPLKYPLAVTRFCEVAPSLAKN